MATFDFAIAVGKVIIEAFYDGDLSGWRNRGPKEAAFRALASHPNLPMSPSALYRSVAMYELCERLQIDRRNHLSTSHLRLVLPLESQAQARLLAEAEQNRWPVRRLEKEVATLNDRDRNRCRGGRKRRSRLRAAIHSLTASLLMAGNLVAGVGEEDASPESHRALLEVIDGVKVACALLEGRLAQYAPRATTDPQRKLE